MAEMFVLYRGEEPVAYLYGDSWAPLWIDGGYPTKEEAIAAWEAENNAVD